MARRRSNSLKLPMATTGPSAHPARFVPEMEHTITLDALFTMLRSRDCGDWMQSVKRASQDWNGNLTFREALDAAEFGKWSAPKIKALTLPELTRASDDMNFFSDVCGEYFDAGAYSAGDPDCWLVAEPIQKPVGRVLRFAVEIGGLGDIDADHLRARGEAIIALVNSLELQGHSVEITIIRAWLNRRKENYRLLVPIKQAGQALDVKRLQFIIGHPAFYRRCLFGLTELAQGADIHTVGTWTKNYAPEGFIHIGHQQGLGPDHHAMQWAKEFAHQLAQSHQLENQN